MQSFELEPIIIVTSALLHVKTLLFTIRKHNESLIRSLGSVRNMYKYFSDTKQSYEILQNTIRCEKPL
jgi:hypothetical protein